MRVPGALPLSLLKLPLPMRLAIVALAYPVCTLLYVLTVPYIHNGVALGLPVMLAAWVFRFRGVFVGQVAGAVCGFIANRFLLAYLVDVPPNTVIDIIVGNAISLLIGTVMATVRYALDKVEELRCKAEQAEQQKILAYEQRLAALKSEQEMALAYKHQRELNRLKDQFIVNVNHELRTPLTETYGYIDMLYQKRDELDAQTRDLFLINARQGCEDLLHLASTLQEAAQISGEIADVHIETLHLVPLLRETLEELEPQEKQEHVLRLECNEELLAYGDAHYVRQILRHLLSNACKYTPGDTAVTVSLGCHKAEDAAGPQVRICVQDRGPGIPADELPLLFERFVRLKRDLYGARRGAGLGLYICRQLVEAMGGRIWVESSGIDGEGCCFCFTLPAAQTKADDQSIKARAVPPGISG